jgi:ABC-type sugar transport system ATPase subunit
MRAEIVRNGELLDARAGGHFPTPPRQAPRDRSRARSVTTATPMVSVEGITKSYPGVSALSDVTFDLRPGEVHALVGENGAGKSTLIRILSGDTAADTGTMRVAGLPVRFANPSDARRLGIVTIFQELTIVPGLTVAENIVLGAEPTIGPGRQVYSRRLANARASQFLTRLAAREGIDPRSPADRLSTAQKQLVEIARALQLQAPVIIMDEPTAALSAKEAEVLLRIIGQLRDEGHSVVFASHRLDEVLSVANRVTVLRGGRHVGTLERAGIDGPGHLIELMIGRPLSALFPPRNESLGEVFFSVRGLGRGIAFDDVSFDVHRGEVLGIAGLIGAGRTEVMRAIFGADPLERGEVFKSGRNLAIKSPRDAIAAGIAYLPEDRKEQGLVLALSGVENIALAWMEHIGFAGIVNWSKISAMAANIARQLQFRGRIEAPARTSSGGNQQKLVIGKWLATEADLLIFDEPTRGIDIGAKVEVYRVIHALAQRGAGIVLVSSELIELMNVAHRIIVMSKGRVQDELPFAEFAERRILTAAFSAHAAVASQTSVAEEE